MKQVFFWNAEHIQLQFKVCALFQFVLDLFLCWQFWAYGAGEMAAKGINVGEKVGTVGYLGLTHAQKGSLSEKIEMGLK